jgi:hypothetical protein
MRRTAARDSPFRAPDRPSHNATRAAGPRLTLMCGRRYARVLESASLGSGRRDLNSGPLVPETSQHGGERSGEVAGSAFAKRISWPQRPSTRFAPRSVPQPFGPLSGQRGTRPSSTCWPPTGARRGRRVLESVLWRSPAPAKARGGWVGATSATAEILFVLHRPIGAKRGADQHKHGRVSASCHCAVCKRLDENRKNDGDERSTEARP